MNLKKTSYRLLVASKCHFSGPVVRANYSYLTIKTSSSYLSRPIPSLISTELLASRRKNISSSKCYLNSNRPNSVIKPFKLSDIGEGIAEVEITRWFVQEGSFVNEYDPLCEAKSDKASVTISSKFSGVINKIYFDENDIVQVGSVLVDISSEVVESDSQKIEHPIDPIPESTNTTKTILASPAVKHLAKVHKVDLSCIVGTARDGRITKQDFLEYTNSLKINTNQVEDDGIKEEPIATIYNRDVVLKSEPTTTHKPLFYEQKLSPIRRGMFKTMTEAAKIPHLVISEEHEINDFYREFNKFKTLMINDQKSDLKITPLSFFIKALSKTLEQFPILNSQIADMENYSLRINNYHNIGVAIDTEHGLIVPVIKDVQNKTVFNIADDIVQLKKLALNDRLNTSHLTDGTITISNIGVLGGTYYSPCILPPQVALVAIGKITKSSDASQNFNLKTSWTADHRIVDGATVMRAINYWDSLISNPLYLAAV